MDTCNNDWNCDHYITPFMDIVQSIQEIRFVKSLRFICTRTVIKKDMRIKTIYCRERGPIHISALVIQNSIIELSQKVLVVV